MQKRKRTTLLTVFGVPIAGLDIFALMLLVFIAGKPIFQDVNPATLPELDFQEPSTGTGGLAAGHRIKLSGNGQATFDDKAVEMAELPLLIADTQPDGSPIYLDLETDKQGQGPIKDFLQLQVDLADAKLWSRVELLHRPAKASSENRSPRPPPRSGRQGSLETDRSSAGERS